MKDDDLVADWLGSEHINIIAKRYGVTVERVMSEWRRLRAEGRLVGSRDGRASTARNRHYDYSDGYDGRLRVPYNDPLLAALNAAHPEKKGNE